MQARRMFMIVMLSGLGALLGLAGCSEDGPMSTSEESTLGGGMRTSETRIDRFDAPDGLVDVHWQGDALRFWPYTGEDLSGKGQDPINLVFVGEVDPVQIRAALMSLDGNRTAYGIPDIYPFNSTWSDAIGNAQTGYIAGTGWTGAVVQLQLGAYDPVRFHLRLIKHGRDGRRADGDDDDDDDDDSSASSNYGWTIGNAHFDLQIPKTPEHQVIDWEYAERIVVVDFVRSGLLDPSSLPEPQTTGLINEAPDWREIPKVIYNGIPDGLKVVLGYTPGDASGPVPIPNDGYATILHLKHAVPVERGTVTQSLTVNFEQMVPKPFCSDGPLDYVFLQGPVNMTQTVKIGRHGRYHYSTNIAGHLMAVYMDVTQSPPAPVGDPFFADITDQQRGFLKGPHSRLTLDSSRIAPQEDGVENLTVKLRVGSRGRDLFYSRAECLDD